MSEDTDTPKSKKRTKKPSTSSTAPDKSFLSSKDKELIAPSTWIPPPVDLGLKVKFKLINKSECSYRSSIEVIASCGVSSS